MQRNFDKLSDELTLHTFSFLSGHDLARLQVVSKHCKKSSSKFISDQLFYTIGKPVCIANYTKMQFKHREIPSQEIKDAFPTNKQISLFPSQEEAQTYARSLRTNIVDSDETVLQPLVYTVQLDTKKLNSKLKIKTQSLEICDVVKRRIYVSKVSFFKAKSNDVVPLFGIATIFKPIFSLPQPQDGPIIQNSRVSFEKKEDPKKFRCVIL